jgi:sugar phosphate isomerase/epimerase
MIRYGFNVANSIRFADEDSFALANGFDILQLGFDRRCLSVHDLDGLHSVEKSRVNTILHVSVGLDEFDGVLAPALELARSLGHHDMIVHPIAGKSQVGHPSKALVSAAKHWVPAFAEHGITIHFENNSRLESVLQSVDDARLLFATCPTAGFLLDIAHMDDYAHLQNLAGVKMPGFLHVADRRLEQIHEHLAVGKGNIDFSRVFTRCLHGFEGTVIFEVPWDAEARGSSKRAIERICQSRDGKQLDQGP